MHLRGFQGKGARLSIGCIAVLVITGVLLMYTGNDAVILGMEKKEGILNAEEVKVSFDSVSGRLVEEAVEEAQEVRKGDVLLVLDSTDVDLTIERLEAQIRQLDAQIASMGGTIDVGLARTDTTEISTKRQIDQQKAAVNAALATLRQRELDYNRMAQLRAEDVISQSEFDVAQTNLDVARAGYRQAQEGLSQLYGGAVETGSTDTLSLPAIANARSEVENQKNDLAGLIASRDALAVQLKEAQVARERLTLRAPEDGRILKILAKAGEMVSPSTPVILMESKRTYYDLYLSEEQVAGLSEGMRVTGTTVAGKRAVDGTVRLITKAPSFADLKNSREKGQTDLSAFQVRIYTDPADGVKTGMTIGVDVHDGFR